LLGRGVGKQTRIMSELPNIDAALIPHMIAELDRVILAEDLPEYGLKAGDIGTVVLIHGEGEGYEVEFTTLDGAPWPHPDRSSRDKFKPVPGNQAATERAAAEAEAAAARAAVLQAEQESRAAGEAERARQEAAEQREREAILAVRRLGRKAKKRRRR